MFIYPLCVFRFPQGISPANGEVALPAFLEEVLEVFPFLVHAAVSLCKKAGGAACAELSLAWTHSYARAPSKVRKGAHVQPVDCRIDLTYRYFFAFADEGIEVSVDSQRYRAKVIACLGSYSLRFYVGFKALENEDTLPGVIRAAIDMKDALTRLGRDVKVSR